MKLYEVEVTGDCLASITKSYSVRKLQKKKSQRKKKMKRKKLDVPWNVKTKEY